MIVATETTLLPGVAFELLCKPYSKMSTNTSSTSSVVLAPRKLDVNLPPVEIRNLSSGPTWNYYEIKNKVPNDKITRVKKWLKEKVYGLSTTVKRKLGFGSPRRLEISQPFGPLKTTNEDAIRRHSQGILIENELLKAIGRGKEVSVHLPA